MKAKIENFRVGDNTYFHHRHGIFVRKNRVRSAAINMSVLVMMFGGFFVGKEFAWPLLQRSGQVQRVQGIAADKFVSAESDINSKSAEPIRQADDLLTSVIEDKIETFSPDQRWSVYVYDLNTERTAMVGVDSVHASAGLYKLFLLEALEQKLPFDQWEWTWVGNSSVKDCVESMLKSTDNPCAQELGDFIGWDAVEKANKASGYKNTKLSEKDGRETSANDVGELFARLKKGQTLSDNARRFIFDALYQQNLKKGIPKGCKDCRTANKSGELNGVAHDAGIVTHGGHSYVIVVMSEGGSFKQIEEITKLVELKLVPKL